MKTLTLEHLAPYLPYELKVKIISDNRNYKTGSIYKMSLQLLHDKFKGNSNKDIFKPILRPLSDLTKEIEHNGEKFVPMVEYSYLRFEEISNYKGGQNVLNFIQLREYKLLLEMHFDIFGLIEQGLAIDINTLEK